jgi:hypothetical protein
MLLFLKLCLSYLVVDFIIRAHWKPRKRKIINDSIVDFLMYLVAGIILINASLNRLNIPAIILLAALRVLGRHCQRQVTRNGTLAAAINHMGFLILLIVVTILTSPKGWQNAKPVLSLWNESPKFYLVLCVYIATVFGGGYFVQKVTQYFMDQIDASLIQSKPGLRNAGKYLGWLERFLVITFVVTGYYEGVGLLLAAKTIARYPEIKGDDKGHFSEYFLIGTLTSLSLALIAAFALVKLGNQMS